MAFKAGEESVAYKLYTGLTDVQVVAINPTKDEAEKLGIRMNNDPVYLSTDDTTGNRKVRLDVYVKSKETDRIDKMAFFLEEVFKTSSNGNLQFINDFGVSTWAPSAEEATNRVDKNGNKWYSGQGIRQCYSGEAELVDFLMKLLNIGRGEIAKLDNPKALFDGNVSELKEVFKANAGREVQVLYYVRENDGNWYQGIYTRFFSRAHNTKPTYWIKHFENSQSTLNYQGSYQFQEFNPLAEAKDTKPVTDAPESIWQ